MARRALIAFALVVGLVSYPRQARAHGGTGILETIFIIAVVGDAAFFTYDTVVVSRNEHPAQGACIAEAIFAAPQFLIYASLTGELGRGRHTGLVAATGTIPTFLTIHGVWGAATEKTSPGALYGVSWATAADLAFTLPAVRQAAKGSLFDRTSGVIEIVATTPQIAVATPAAIRETGPERSAWYALDGWAGVLFLHGAASTMIGDHEPPPPEPPPEPPPPVPAQTEPTPSGPLEIETPQQAPKPTGAFLVPGTLTVHPMAVQGGAGLSIGAILW